MMTRRAWLITSGAALSGAAVPESSAHAAVAPHPPSIKLALNENPMGPSPLALKILQGEIGEVCRYSEGGTERQAGIGAAANFDRLAIAAAAGSLQDTGYVASMRDRVATEREEWNRLFDALKVRHSDSSANFVFFETGRPHQEFSAALRTSGIDIGRAFPPLERWARISIGLPEENQLAREAVAELLR